MTERTLKQRESNSKYTYAVGLSNSYGTMGDRYRIKVLWMLSRFIERDDLVGAEIPPLSQNIEFHKDSQNVVAFPVKSHRKLHPSFIWE